MIDALFGSKTRVKLLHLFLNNPNRAFYVREITRKIDEQINSVRRELANMLNIGIIVTTESSSNNRLYYEVNQKYDHYKPLKAIFGDDKLQSQAASEVEANDWGKRFKLLGDVRIALFSGSLVLGSQSEVDVFLAGTVNKSQVKKFIKELESEEGRSLNYVVMPYEDFYYRMSIRDRFVTNIINSKLTLLQDSEDILSAATD